MCHGLVGGWSLSIRELGHHHIPVTPKVWPHHQCSASPSALVWAARTASVRASSCAMLCSSCCSQAARASVATPRHVLLAPSALSDPGQWDMSGERAVLVWMDGNIQSLLLIQYMSGHCLWGEGLPEELSGGNYLSARQLSRAIPETADTQHPLSCRRVRGCTQPAADGAVKRLFVPAVMNTWGLEGADPSSALELWLECRNTGSKSKHFGSLHTRLPFGMV